MLGTSRATLKAIRLQVAANLQAAWRTGFYGLAGALLRGREAPLTKSEQRTILSFWREAFVVQRDTLLRPHMAQWLRQLERDDWVNFPLFALMLPFDLRRAASKRRGKGTQPVRPTDSFVYPAYYLHDFHNQLNGGLSSRAASTYEWQIRLVFAGANRIMRQAVIDALPKDKTLEILDVGCGAAAWLPQARLQGHLHHLIGVDLSPHYLAEAEARRDAEAEFAQYNGENFPEAWSERFDCIVCIWLYHELPPEAQENVTATMARVLKPGGTVLLMDAMQQEDVPDRDIGFINQRFAHDFDEPYFAQYQQLNLNEHFRQHGFEVVERRRCFVSHFIQLRKPKVHG